MARITFTQRAKADLFRIREYSLGQWGVARTARYLRDMGTCFERLQKNPKLGRSCDEIYPDLRRIEHGSHVVFYRESAEQIVVSRVLHKSMLPGRHEMED